MNKEKQIEEMRYLADELGKAISTEYEKRVLADERKLEEALKANGWRKASEVAREIFEEIENIAILNGYISVKDFYTEHPLIAELKKKYTEGGNVYNG